MEMKENTEPASCIVCGREKSQGIYIVGQFLCRDCEQDIVHTDVEEERYQHYIACMKRIWLQALAGP